MRETPSGDSPEPILENTIWADAAETLFRSFELQHSADFYLALEKLDGIAMLERYAGGEGVDTKNRREAAKAYKNIGPDARRALALLQKIASSVKLIVETGGLDAPLSVVEKVLQIEDLPYDAYYPKEIGILETIATSSEWRPVLNDLLLIGGLSTGSAESKEWSSMAGLAKALTVCRSYLKLEGMGWSYKSLKDDGIKNTNNKKWLKGQSEKLVAYMLACAGLKYSLTNIRSMWKKIELVEWEV